MKKEATPCGNLGRATKEKRKQIYVTIEER
jgi:hypothetical protein